MDISSLHRAVRPDSIPLDRLSTSSVISKEEKLQQVSKHFEAILVRQILTDAQKPVFGGGALKDSSTTSIYRDLMTEKLADTVSKSGQFGLASSLQTQLTHQLTRPPSRFHEGDQPSIEKPLKTGPRSHLQSHEKSTSASRLQIGPENP